MGLDGISVNQLRSISEQNSNELNSVSRFSSDNNSRPVDGLSSGQRINPDKEKEHEKQEFNEENENNDNQEDSEQPETEVPVKKYDLSQSDKYVLKVNNDTNEVLIVDKKTKATVQKIDAENLSAFVNFLSYPQGSIINRKF